MASLARAAHGEGHRAVNHRGVLSGGASAQLWVGCVAVIAGCSTHAATDNSHAGNTDAGVHGMHPPADVRLRFEPGSNEAIPFGDVPWPSDLYVNAAGRIAFGALPGGAESALTGQLREAVGHLDGFGATGPILFYLDGPIDPASLPTDAAASMEDGSAVFVVDVDTNSPEAFQRVPVEAYFDEPRAQLSLMPARGYALAPGRRYAAVVTRALLDMAGTPVGSTDAFLAATGPVAPEDPRLAKAHASFSPVLTQLDKQGVARQDVVGLAVFRVQGVTDLLERARVLIRSEPPAFAVVEVLTDLDGLLGVPEMNVAGLDLAGGVLHAGIGGMVRGRFSSKNFLVDEERGRGRFETDGSGNPTVKRVDEVRFTIWMPPAPVQLGNVPVILYVHDLNGDRSHSVVAANQLAAAGYAVVAVDLPFHGSRSAGADELNRFTGEAVPDGFGDGGGDFVGRFEQGAELLPLHPAFYRGAMQQSVVDVMQLVHMIENGDFSGFFVGTEYAGLAFDTENIGVLGVGIGGEVGLIAATMEESLGAVEALFAGGHVTDVWASSPSKQEAFDELILALGIAAPRGPDAPSALLWPAMALYQTALDAGDPLLLARALRRTACNALIVMAADDEVVPNRNTEAIAFAVGAQFANGTATHVRGLETLNADGSISGNFVVGQEAVTRLLTLAQPATHDALIHRAGTRFYEASTQPPVAQLPEPQTVANPLDALLAQSAAFFNTWRICAAGNATSSCPASVMPLQ